MQSTLRKLEDAITRLEEALNQELNEFIRDSVIKRFEFSFELLWKLIKKIAESESLECYSPKSCMKLGYQMGLINNEDTFLSMLEYRNLTVHMYNEVEAQEVYEFVKNNGLKAFKDVLREIRIKLGE